VLSASAAIVVKQNWPSPRHATEKRAFLLAADDG
jgi:hypothetical protein